MADEPSYPDDSPVGDPVGRDDSSAPSQKPTEGTGRKRQIATGAALGIGSAAVVAALLYANRSRKGGKSPRDGK